MYVCINICGEILELTDILNILYSGFTTVLVTKPLSRILFIYRFLLFIKNF